MHHRRGKYVRSLKVMEQPAGLLPIHDRCMTAGGPHSID